MAYQPNFSDSRVQQRTKRAIGFACGVLSSTKPHAWSTRYIDKWFGVQSNSLSKYLREQLLIVTNDSYQWGEKSKCKEYILNQSGVDYLCSAIGMNKITTNNTPIVLQVVSKEYKSEFDTGNFTYNDQSNRLWHPLQNFKRDYKKTVLEQNGYKFHYDVQCCAMTLIHQHAQQQAEPMDQYLFALNQYLADRQRIREQIAKETDVDPETVKRIINALLAGAKLSANTKTEIYQMLQGDVARIKFLQQHEYLTQLREDIKTCWDYIKPSMPRRSKQDKNKRERMIPISSRQKWGVYFDLERQVLNEVREFLRETNNKHFLEHDGWSCEREIDHTSLSARVLDRTGFRVDFESK